MGIYGLTSYLSSYLYKYENIDIIKLSQKMKANIILVDGISLFLSFLRLSKYDCVNIDYFNYINRLNVFINIFEYYNIKLIFYFDTNPINLTKSKTSESRSNEKIESIIKFNDWLDERNNFNDFNNHKVYPPLLVSILRKFIKSINPESVKLCEGEADYYLARDGAASNVLGVLATDSDFFVTKNIRFLYFESFCFGNLPFGPDTKTHDILEHPRFENWDDFNKMLQIQKDHSAVLTCKVLSCNEIAKHLQIPVESLPFFSLLCGNDYSKESGFLPEFWSALYSKFKCHSLVFQEISFARITDAIKFIKHHLNGDKFSYFHDLILSLGLSHDQTNTLIDALRETYVSYCFDIDIPSSSINEPEDFIGQLISQNITCELWPSVVNSLYHTNQCSLTMPIENIDEIESGLILQPLLKSMAILMGRNESFLISRKFIKLDRSVMSGEFISRSSYPFCFVEDGLYNNWNDMNKYFLLSKSLKILDQHVLNLPPIMVLNDICAEERLKLLMYPLVSPFHLKTVSDLKQIVFPGSILPYLTMPLYSLIYYLSQMTKNSKNKLHLSEFFSLLYSVVFLACIRSLLTDSVESLSKMPSISIDVDATANKPFKRLVSILSHFQLVMSTVSSYSNLIGLNELCHCELGKSFISSISDPRFLYHTKILKLFYDSISPCSSLSKQKFYSESLTASVNIARTCIGLNPVFPKEVLTDSLKDLFTIQCQWMINQISLIFPNFYEELDKSSGKSEFKLVDLATPLKKEISHSVVVPPQITSTTELEDLPIMKYEDLILNQIKEKPVIIIQGETGSGKSSRVPQIIYRNAVKESKKRTINILITQPRRIAAISAQRVANELDSPLGSLVGFRIGMQQNASENTKILYVTTGWLLQRLISRPKFLFSLSHLILDEVHERSVDSDILCVIIKRLLAFGDLNKFETPKLILMSATFNTDLFASFFQPGIPNESIFVGTRRFPVTVYFLEDIFDIASLNSPLYPAPVSRASIQKLSSNQSMSNVKTVNEILVWCCLTIANFHRADPEGNCILIFLAGLQDITDVYSTFDKTLADENLSYSLSALSLDFIMLHSMVDNQLDVFKAIPAGQTRIVLSTNISESSVTIPNVRYVFDFGQTKQIEYNPKFHCPILQKTTISKASAAQRMGRCGRLMPGVCIRLYSKMQFEEMNPYDTPEIRRIQLSSTILRLKISSVSQWKIENDEIYESNIIENEDDQKADELFNDVINDPELILRETLEPPSVDAIHTAFTELFTNKALVNCNQNSEKDISDLSSDFDSGSDYESDVDFDDTDSEDEKVQTIKTEAYVPHAVSIYASSTVTELGRFFASIPIDFRYAKGIAFAASLYPTVLPHIIIIGVSLSQQDVFALPHQRVVTDSLKYAKLVAHSTFGRFSFDNNKLSDALSIVFLLKQYFLFVQSNGHVRNVSAKFPSYLREIDNKSDPFFSNDQSTNWCYAYGVSPDRLKSLLNSIAELALRIAKILPNCSAYLNIFASLVRLGRGLRSNIMKNSSDETTVFHDFHQIDIEKLMPMDDFKTIPIIHLILSLSMPDGIAKANILPATKGSSINFECTGPDVLTFDNLKTIPELIPIVSQITEFKGFASSKTKAVCKFKFLESDLIELFDIKNSNGNVSMISFSCFNRLCFHRMFGFKELSLSKLPNIVGMSEKVIKDKCISLNTVVCDSKASLKNLFTKKSVMVSETSIVKQATSMISSTNSRDDFVSAQLKQLKATVREMERKGIAPPSLNKFEKEEIKYINKKAADLDKSEEFDIYGLILSPVVSQSGSVRTDRMSYLPFQTKSERHASFISILLSLPGDMVVSNVYANFRSSDGNCKFSVNDLPPFYFKCIELLREKLVDVLDDGFTSNPPNLNLLEYILKLFARTDLTKKDLDIVSSDYLSNIKYDNKPSNNKGTHKRLVDKDFYKPAGEIQLNNSMSKHEAIYRSAYKSSAKEVANYGWKPDAQLKIMSKNSTIQCPSCTMTFMNRSELISHHLEKHIASKVAKPYLSGNTRSESELSETEIFYDCDVCLKTFESWESLSSHKISKHKIAFKSKDSNLMESEKVINAHTQYRCCDCKKIFRSEEAISSHCLSKTHTMEKDNKVVTCINCSALFTSKIKYENHLSTCKPKQKDLDVYKSSSTLFTCTYCSGLFTNKSKYDSHSLTCVIKSQKDFMMPDSVDDISATDLTNHFKSSLEVLSKNHICSCGKSFMQQIALEYHMKAKGHQLDTLSGVKPVSIKKDKIKTSLNKFECMDCNKSFKFQEALDAHLLIKGHKPMY